MIFPFSSYCGTNPQQHEHACGCCVLVVVTTTGGWGGWETTTVLGTICVEHVAVRTWPFPSVAVTVAVFVPVVANVTLRDWVEPVTSPLQKNEIGATPPAYPATKVTVFPTCADDALAEHATLKKFAGGMAVIPCTNTVTFAFVDEKLLVQVIV